MKSLDPSFGLRIHSVLVIAAVVSLLGCGGDDPAAVDLEPVVYPAQAFHETLSFSGTSFSADESRILLTSDQSGIFNVYAQPFEGGTPTALTESTTESIRGVSWFPGDDRFLYTSDEGGNELNHLFVREPDGTETDLTPGDGVKASFAGWSGDKSSFYVVTNERDPSAVDLYRYSAADYSRELLFENDGHFLPGPVSKDGRWWALNHAISNANSDVWVADLSTGATRLVTPHEGDIFHTAVTFSPDSESLYYSTNGPGEFTEIWVYSLATEEHRPVIREDWDVNGLRFSDSGRYRVAWINEDASTRVSIVDTEESIPFEIPDLPPGDVTGVRFSPSETRLAFYLVSDRAPGNLWVYDLDSDGPPRALTESLNPEIDPAQLVGSDVVRYPSFDGLEIPAILWRPNSASAEAPVPAVVWVHGGPGGQSRRTYSATIQHLANHGYAVLAVNNRGSSGYGKTFFHMDDRKHGEVDLQDVVNARTYLESLDWVDGENIAIAGGSYGGYMVAAALAFEPEVFDAGIDIFGVTNWLRTLSEMPPWWGAQRDALYAELGNPETDRERLRRISPLFHAHNIVKPLLVIQGANDPRVLQVESDELVAAAKESGAPVEYVLFPDEGHGFSKRVNRIEASEHYVRFLDTYLKGSPDTP